MTSPASRPAVRVRTTRPAPRSGGAADPCPLCGCELGRPRGATRRRIVFTAERGCFRWQCPDCRGVWTQGAT